MPPRVLGGNALSTDQVQLLCLVVQYSESPKRESWDIIAEKLGITTGNAAQQRFGRLLKSLKATDPTGTSDGGTPKSKTASQKATPGKHNGTPRKKARSNTKNVDEDDEDQDEDELAAEETPSKKRKSWKPEVTPEWKSIFESNEVIKLEDDEEGEDGEDGTIVTKPEDELTAEVVNWDHTV